MFQYKIVPNNADTSQLHIQYSVNERILSVIIFAYSLACCPLLHLYYCENIEAGGSLRFTEWFIKQPVSHPNKV